MRDGSKEEAEEAEDDDDDDDDDIYEPVRETFPLQRAAHASGRCTWPITDCLAAVGVVT